MVSCSVLTLLTSSNPSCLAKTGRKGRMGERPAKFRKKWVLIGTRLGLTLNFMASVEINSFGLHCEVSETYNLLYNFFFTRDIKRLNIFNTFNFTLTKYRHKKDFFFFTMLKETCSFSFTLQSIKGNPMYRYLDSGYIKSNLSLFIV